VKQTLKTGRPAENAAQQRRAAAQRARGMLAGLGEGRSLADELIAERRAEAQDHVARCPVAKR
jgi:hypothetical protein